MNEKEITKLEQLTPDGDNFNRHTEFGQKLLEDSLRKFGAGRSIVVDKHGNIIAGNSTAETAAAIGMDDVITVKSDGKKLVVVQRTDLDLDSPEGRELALADNMTALKGIDMDLDKVRETLGDDLAKAWGMDIPEVQKQAQEDDFDPDKPVETVCKKGDIWKLGNHRLMCGDSTDAASVDLLMEGQKADICFTSPPYNMGGENGSWASVPNIAMKAGQAYNEYTDDVSDEEYSKLLTNSCINAIEHCDDVLFNIGVLSNSRKGIVAMLHELQDNFFEILTWKKTSCLPLGMKSQKGMVSHLCEPIFCFNKDGLRRFSHPQWQAGCGRNIIETQNASGNEYAKEHAATFPVEFAAEAIKMFCDNSVLDLFGGSGTTLIAAEQLNRKCFMMELDPHYCDVIIARWEKLTGNKAERISHANE